MEEIILPALGAIGRAILWLAMEAIFHVDLLFTSSRKKDKKQAREDWRKTRRVRKERALKGLERKK
jgi:hypothetical protein